MSTSLSIPILLLAAILQTTLVPVLLRVFNAEPDLIFLIVLSWSIHARTEVALLWAFVGGIAADLLSAAPTGASVVGLILAVSMVTALRGQLTSVGTFSLIGLTIAGTIVHKLTYLVIVGASGIRAPMVSGLLLIVLPTVVYNLIALLPVYHFSRFVQRRAERSSLGAAPRI
ncbi:MAG: rod shape-determining protein MreD [Chloroflexota bacterium]|nr:rod shape-determining protein MreD [Chloroflexota bacterium]